MNATAIIWGAFLSFIVAFSFVVFVIYRQKRESFFRQKEAELGRQVAEVEMKALRSQMNPHFIFNALSSVYRFMEKNDLHNAGQYLLKVSSLMRRVLENSLHKEVPLEDDMDALKIYIEIEQMRLQHSFEFRINIASDIDPENTYVPPLIIQPFIENAIWHGLKNRKTGGLLNIEVFKKDDMLNYIIDDNGDLETEHESAGVLGDGKKKSVGMSITRERLDVLNKTKNAQAAFTILDKTLEDGSYGGKKINLKLPLEEM